MSDSNSPPPSPTQSSRRRSSFTAGSLSELFGRANSTSAASGTPAYPSSIASAAAQVQTRRRMSISTVGLSGSPVQTSPLGSRGLRQGSISSSVGSISPGIDESAIEEGDATVPQNTPASPFARRVSFGAQALREVRAGTSTTNGRNSPPSSKETAGPPSAAGGRGKPLTPIASRRSSTDQPLETVSNTSWRSIGEGYNWSESLRNRAERAPSFGTGSFSSAANAPNGQNRPNRARAVSTASMEPPVKEMPKVNKPDYFQEKILKGDFMD